jgi:hypothetical protein
MPRASVARPLAWTSPAPASTRRRLRRPLRRRPTSSSALRRCRREHVLLARFGGNRTAERPFLLVVEVSTREKGTSGNPPCSNPRLLSYVRSLWQIPHLRRPFRSQSRSTERGTTYRCRPGSRCSTSSGNISASPAQKGMRPWSMRSLHRPDRRPAHQFLSHSGCLARRCRDHDRRKTSGRRQVASAASRLH